ncbi:hypothetical protein HBI75_074840 [Parastagonospora nodorum]|nr:hypothetical protein HBI75_074840 [Parastagonospora nodorum]
MSARFSNRRLHPDAPGGEAGAKGNAEMVRTCSKLHILFYLFFCIVYQLIAARMIGRGLRGVQLQPWSIMYMRSLM